MKMPLSSFAALLALGSAVSAQVQVGDILVAVHGAGSLRSVQVYRPNGVQVLSTTGGTGDSFLGVAITASGQLITTRSNPSGFDVFDSMTGVEVATHDTPAVLTPGDIDVFSDGTLAIADQSESVVHYYSQSGVYLGDFAPSAPMHAFGLEIDTNDELWATEFPPFGYSYGYVFHFARNGAELGHFFTYLPVDDLAVAPDGTIWCTCPDAGGLIQYDASGTMLSFLQTPDVAHCAGVTLAADGTFFVTGASSIDVFHYDAAGVLINQFPLIGATSGPLFLHVVEDPAGLIGPYCTAGTSSQGCVAQIAASSQPSVALANTCNITVSSVDGQKFGLLFYGLDNTNFAPHAWSTSSSSWLCVKSPLQRTSLQLSGGSTGQCNGSFALDWNAYQQNHPSALGQPWSVGSRVYLQAWYRDPPAPKSTNLSDAMYMRYVP